MVTLSDADRLLLSRPALIMLLVVCLLLSGNSYAANSSESYVRAAEDSCLTTQELAGLNNLIDDLQLKIKLLEIDNRALVETAEVDSMMAARRMRVVREQYEDIVEQYKESRPSFLERLIRQPVLWLAVGTYFGSHATR